MKKIALSILLFVTVHVMSCSPKPEEEIPQTGDSLTKTIEGQAPPNRVQTDPTRENYILPIDTAYARLESGNSIISVLGPLGDGCQKFEYTDSVKEGSTLMLTFWASRPKDPNTVCTQQMQAYQKEIRVDPVAYTRFVVVEPGGTERPVTVAP